MRRLVGASLPVSTPTKHAPQAELTRAVRDLLGRYLEGEKAVAIESGFAEQANPDWALGDSRRDPTNLFLVLKVGVGVGDTFATRGPKARVLPRAGEGGGAARCAEVVTTRHAHAAPPPPPACCQSQSHSALPAHAPVAVLKCLVFRDLHVAATR